MSRERQVALGSLDGFLAFGFGLGLMPKAPGTWGTLAGIPFVLFSAQLDPFYSSLLLVSMFFLGIHICERVSKRLGVHDHGGIVWDEIVGYMIAVLGFPAEAFWLIAGFILFRVFDILKPWPIRKLDKNMKGGLGIMMDDVLAGVFAWIGLQLIVSLLDWYQSGLV